ncbi:MAG: hypothetical protein ACK58M_07155, partial [Acidobacteriota bacterium]
LSIGYASHPPAPSITNPEIANATHTAGPVIPFLLKTGAAASGVAAVAAGVALVTTGSPHPPQNFLPSPSIAPQRPQ